MGRRETTSLEEMSKGMAVSRIPWLKAFSQKNNESCNQEKDMSNCLSCSGLLNSFLYWIYTSVVNSLLRSCFYITEAESLGNEVYYYFHYALYSLIILSIFRCYSIGMRFGEN